jgi:hypothetical protein
MRIRTAVADYMRMFPEDWKECQIEIGMQRQNLDNEYATINATHAIQRALFSVPEKLSIMIGKKLETDELVLFKEKEGGRWFAKEFPQFAISREV